MLQVLREILGAIGLRSWTDDDYINAEQDDKLHEHSKAIEAVRASTAKRREVNWQLRESIREAKRTTRDAFADFEHMLQDEQKRKKANGRGG